VQLLSEGDYLALEVSKAIVYKLEGSAFQPGSPNQRYERVSNEVVSREDILNDASIAAFEAKTQRDDDGPLVVLKRMLRDTNFDFVQDEFWRLQTGLGKLAPNLSVERADWGRRKAAGLPKSPNSPGWAPRGAGLQP